MEDGSRVSEKSVTIRTSAASEEVRPSYWLDACEDISCDLIGELVDFDVAPAAPTSNGNRGPANCNLEEQEEEDGLGNDFFGGLDHILDSIKNGAGLPPVAGRDDGENAAPGIPKAATAAAEVESSTTTTTTTTTAPVNNGAQLNNLPAGRGNKSLYGAASGEERCGKRARVGSCSGRGQYCHPRERERCFSRKRPRDWEDIERRERDCARRKERHSSNRRDGRDRDWRDREPKGYWERDKSGSNEMVFRFGSYESDRHREGRVANDKNQECNGKAEDKSDEPKERIPEEQARKYQLDVLEQAKNRNTIAFLETGAGKTLIAVLLIKSLCNDLQKQNKKLLAVFLVPKVPLVYQVTLCRVEEEGSIPFDNLICNCVLYCIFDQY